MTSNSVTGEAAGVKIKWRLRMMGVIVIVMESRWILAAVMVDKVQVRE